MQNKLEKLIKLVYKEWKSGQPKEQQLHHDEETMVSFWEGRLSAEEGEQVMAHLISCDSCMDAFLTSAQLEASEEEQIPEALVERVKNLFREKDEFAVLEIFLRLKENLLELVNTTGDVLVGQELMPASVLRSRKIKDFKDEVTILKDFKDLRVEIKIESKGAQSFDLTVTVKEKYTSRLIKDLRITLLRADLELESYLTDSGKVTFEHVLLGKYTVEISNITNKLASILVDIKI
jgi:hypothetical protein